MLKLTNISAKHCQSGLVIRLTLIFLIPTLFAGCFANYGTYRLSRDVAETFESLQLPAEYKYYYSGSEKSPDALMGLHRNYILKNDLWKETDMDRKVLNKWIDEINLIGYLSRADGRYILDLDDNIIGIYYSKWEGGPVRMESGRQVVIHLPDTQWIQRSQ